MTDNIVTHYEFYISDEEQKMLHKVVDWIEEILLGTDDNDIPDLPAGIVEILTDINDNIIDLLELVPDEH